MREINWDRPDWGGHVTEDPSGSWTNAEGKR